MDIFNQEKIGQLEGRIIRLEAQNRILIEEKDKIKERLKGLEDLEENPNNPFMRYFRWAYSWLRAITEHLGLEEYQGEIPDMSYVPKEQPMIRVIKVRPKSVTKKSAKSS